ncbi:uncharacterized protein LOC143452014 [Clavelina lepadiformis]|uniref:uncharacterized protein LOC143452014 n=1 Tax=Clavelina lepadiformis TaxID=159417 RepID=UPI00404235E4
MNLKLLIFLILISCFLVPSESWGRLRRKWSIRVPKIRLPRVRIRKIRLPKIKIGKAIDAVCKSRLACLSYKVSKKCKLIKIGKKFFGDDVFQHLQKIRELGSEDYDDAMQDMVDQLSDQFNPEEINDALQVLDQTLDNDNEEQDSSEDSELMDLLEDTEENAVNADDDNSVDDVSDDDADTEQ